jgi:ribosome biogenesis GTPase / thiamine phosphate phosphatase
MMRAGGRLDGVAGGPQAGRVSLEDVGWNDGWAEAARIADGEAGDDPSTPARVIIEHRGAYEVTDGESTLWAELPGRAYFDARDKRALPAVGDWVRLGASRGGGAAVIRGVLPRSSLIVRRAAGEKTAPQPIAANVDVGFIVTSANSDLNPRRLERYLVILSEGGVRPVIVLSKGDLVSDASVLVAQVESIAPRVAVAVTSAVDGKADALRDMLGRGTGVLIGSSGVGKSTLLNLLLGREAMATREIRESDERGKHTTTRRELFSLPGGGVLIDTPGMRELTLWAQNDDDEVTEFADVEALAASCRFADCQHHEEPGCAVREAAGNGGLDPRRLASFHKLGAELVAEEKRRDAAAKAEEKRRGKVVARSLRARVRDKNRGD